MSFLRVKEWENYELISHGFGMRSEPEARTSKKDWRGHTLKEKGEIFSLIAPRQVHGDRVIILNQKGEKIGDLWVEEGDALITRLPGYALSVFTADCLPILLFDPLPKAIGIVHTGWKGTARGLARKTVEKMREMFACRKENILAAMGPCIGPCCYEVDGPVKEVFLENGLPWDSLAFSRGRGKWSLDLYLANAFLLKEGGVKEENIRRVEFCTSCRPEAFYSYRGQRETRKRMLNYIALRKKAEKSS